MFACKRCKEIEELRGWEFWKGMLVIMMIVKWLRKWLNSHEFAETNDYIGVWTYKWLWHFGQGCYGKLGQLTLLIEIEYEIG